jgi:hypothetical protein
MQEMAVASTSKVGYVSARITGLVVDVHVPDGLDTLHPAATSSIA